MLYFIQNRSRTIPRNFRPGFFPPVNFPKPFRDEREIPGSPLPGVGLLPHEVAALAMLKKRKQESQGQATQGPTLLERMQQARTTRQEQRASQPSILDRVRQSWDARRAERPAPAPVVERTPAPTRPTLPRPVRQPRDTTRPSLVDRMQTRAPEATARQRQLIEESLTPMQRENLETAQNYAAWQEARNTPAPEPSVLQPTERAPVDAAPAADGKKKALMAAGVLAAIGGAWMLFQ